MTEISKIYGVEESCPWMGRLPSEAIAIDGETTIPPGSAIIVDEGRKKRLMSMPKGGKIRGPLRVVVIENADTDLVKTSDPMRFPKALATVAILSAIAFLIVNRGPYADDLVMTLMPLFILVGFLPKMSRVRREKYTIEYPSPV